MPIRTTKQLLYQEHLEPVRLHRQDNLHSPTPIHTIQALLRRSRRAKPTAIIQTTVRRTGTTSRLITITVTEVLVPVLPVRRTNLR